MQRSTQKDIRETVFISKATPEDDEFVLWLAPRLEAEGYTVFADILSLEPGDRWRKRVTDTLQNRANKMLLCCRNATLTKNGVQEEIGIAEDLVKELNDPRFIIPMRIKPFKKIFGIGELQYVDFVGSWAQGLRDLLNTLEKQGVPKSTGELEINPNWEAYKKRLAIKVEEGAETLTLNWLRIIETPDVIRYYTPTGSIDHSLLRSTCQNSQYPAEVYLRGFFSFVLPEEINSEFAHLTRFKVHSEYELNELRANGSASPDIRPREASNLVISMFRKAWENFCRSKGLLEFTYSKQLGFHITKEHVGLGKRISWGRQAQRRNSMLRNISRGKVWQYGLSAYPSLWPYPHFKLKSRVLFAELSNKEAGNVIEETNQQHRFRRSICSSWRNKAWHGRLMAYLELLSLQSESIYLPVSKEANLKLDSQPVLVTSPVTTALPDVMDEDAEEQDISTLGNYMFVE